MEGGSAAVEKFDSHNLRDFLRIKEEDRHSIMNSRISANDGVGRSSITLGAVLSDRIRPVRPADRPVPRLRRNRTLLDIIRDDRAPQRRDRTSWLQLKEKLRLRCGVGGSSGAATVPMNSSRHTLPQNPSTSFAASAEVTQLSNAASSNLQTGPIPTTDGTNGRMAIVNSPYMTLQRQNNNHDSQEPQPRRNNEAGEDEEHEQQPARMSLMALLEETDRHLGFDRPTYTPEDEDEDEDEDESAEGDLPSSGIELNSCCVCMVRPKGAAFIPCGHTFCRLCCRELLAQRGNCPLCNIPILEILDIF